MQLILSRKGFDSSAGGKPSPIFPDETMVSLPIPERGSGTRYEELRLPGHDFGLLVEQLTHGKIRANDEVHMDPDLRAETRRRRLGWRASLGQVDAAQGALRNAGVGPGDLFLFFGWFQDVSKVSGKWSVRPGLPRHVLFGWLQIEEVLRVAQDAIPSWADDHPHVCNQDRGSNTIYVASNELVIEGSSTGLPGAGTFPRYHQELCLTAPGERRRSFWHLPGWFLPTAGKPALGYHADLTRWRALDCGKVELRSAARGQEFVLDAKCYPEAAPWALSLIRRHSGLAQGSTSRPRVG